MSFIKIDLSVCIPNSFREKNSLFDSVNNVNFLSYRMSDNKQIFMDLLRLRPVCMDFDYLKAKIERLASRRNISETGPFGMRRPPPILKLFRNSTGSARTEGFKGRKIRPFSGSPRIIRGKLCVKRSETHGFGVFALAPILPGEIVCDWVGESMRPIVAKQRMMTLKKRFLSPAIPLEPNKVVNPSLKGNICRFLNHECEPNCTDKYIFVDGVVKICIVAVRFIDVHEELTINYYINNKERKIPCFCRSSQCKNFIDS